MQIIHKVYRSQWSKKNICVLCCSFLFITIYKVPDENRKNLGIERRNYLTVIVNINFWPIQNIKYFVIPNYRLWIYLYSKIYKYFLHISWYKWWMKTNIFKMFLALTNIIERVTFFCYLPKPGCKWRILSSLAFWLLSLFSWDAEVPINV